jgi:LacI family transcriptional regulator
MKRRRISSHDVAREAGVSQTTVSLVLNGRTDVRISEETRQRVLDVARNLNYSRNASARALVTGRTHRVELIPIHPGALVDPDKYYATVLAGVTEGALQCGYNLLIQSALYPTWRDMYTDVMSGSADGVLLIGRASNDKLTAALREARFPTVCISFQPDFPDYYSVDCDNVQGARLAVEHLLELGHRRIVYIAPEPEHSWGRERWQGAQAAVADAGLPPETIQYAYFGAGIMVPDVRIERTVALLRSGPNPPTALLYCGEADAQLAAEALPEHGIRVPTDVSIVSFNSTEMSERTRPPLTSVWQPLHAIGEAAVKMVTSLAEGHEAPSGTMRFPCRLDIRESTARAPMPA